ncbi:MAG: ABC transporter permease [Alphaproteobacteria bacterium]|jgi:peptide/nickel transport system permease protein|nr:ABC transporter permease [Alphaproteobacteria bacterium]MDP6819699.1 ABC transporter permease [Alphaproteobacteria bacterium]|tara:strand:+ start:758 stop:1690 length:933 start_codon:yes stop_codon:yes gene_type:complete
MSIAEPDGRQDAPAPKARRFARMDRFGGNKFLVFGLFVVALSIFLAAFGATISPYDPIEATGDISVPPPPLVEWPNLFYLALSGQLEQPPHWFGTDQSGLDVFSRVISAPRADMSIALGGALISLFLGTFLGLIAGFYRNWATELMMRVSDVLQAFPVFITAMILVALAGRETGNLVLALVLVYTPIFIRLTRAEVMSQSARGYVQAAWAVGNGGFKIAVKHVLPNSLVPSLVQLSVTVGFAIILTAGLSFVGAGVRPPTPEWGIMISVGATQLILGEWWPSIFPGLAITITVFGYAVVGHAIEQKFREA